MYLRTREIIIIKKNEKEREGERKILRAILSGARVFAQGARARAPEFKSLKELCVCELWGLIIARLA